MTTIQDRLLLTSIMSALARGKKTKTILRRNLGPTASDVDRAIEAGLKLKLLKSLTQGYVQLVPNAELTILEADYYDSVGKMLERYYQERLTDDGRFLVAKTARKDTKVAGRWTRPDFTVVANRKFPYIREPEFDIITFEVKRPADCEALAVFEALAHNSAATRSYVFFPITQEDLDGNLQGERIREECVRHGIGLFLAKDRFRLDEACLVIESQRRPLNPEKCSQFLQNVLEAGELSKLTTWP
ncbi:hypothetical protein [Phenylobacterium sp.]|uniref:hypothetical protein n=1 Tax=Phenylobacterium sp. TaxID=1871053 RepID=UPI0027314FD7|nr:hypothetical protein [Phenylobacterium sp.]MDP2214922.1 hypothetical protein [Phenylobacterium sp.]